MKLKTRGLLIVGEITNIVIPVVALLSSIIFSCKGEEDIIVAKYFPGHPDFSVSPRCGELVTREKKPTDTLYITHEDFMLLKKNIKTLSSRREREDKTAIFTITYKDINVCMDFDSMSVINTKQKKYAFAEYFCKWKSGYYNYLDDYDIEHSPFIRSFGKPKDFAPTFIPLDKPIDTFRCVIIKEE